MKRILKSRIFTFILGLIVMASVVGVYAINASEITYNNTTVEEELNDLYLHTDPALRPVLLWTNPNPTADFAAQTISMNLSEYKYVVITTKQKTSNDLLPRTSTIIPIGDYTSQIRLSATNTTATRNVRANASGINFSTGVNGTSNTYSDYAIPYKIYGIKGDLGIDIGIDE